MEKETRIEIIKEQFEKMYGKKPKKVNIDYKKGEVTSVTLYF